MDIEHLEKDITVLHDRTQDTKTKIITHEAVCQERYEAILAALDKFDTSIDEIRSEIQELKTLATQGKTGLRVFLFFGGIITGAVALVAAIAGVFK